MNKFVILGLVVLTILIGLPLLALAVITTSTSAAADCRNASQQSQTTTVDPSQLGDLGTIDGPTGRPVTGTVGLASANIPNRSGLAGLRASMPKVLSTRPDFVTLNEVSARSLDQLRAAAPGYQAYRDPTPAAGPGGNQSMGDVVMWKDATWTLRSSGRVKIVEDDQAYYSGRPVTWDRFATWTMLQRKSDGAVVSVISVHHMTNPAQFPRQHHNPPLTRTQQYGQGMDILIKLTNSLATHGPVLVGGDLNTPASYAKKLDWSAAAKMSAAGWGWYSHSVDFVFFPQYQGVKLLKSWTGPMVSDHQWVAARLEMNNAGPTQPTNDAPESKAAAAKSGAVDGGVDGISPAPASDVHERLTRLQLTPGGPRMTSEQATNAIRIAQVARDLRIPRRGLEVAIATALQESTLNNLSGGDRDSAGLFQQRPSAGWGTLAQITNPTLAAQAFFGRAPQTNNPGLLDIRGWQQMPLTQAAQAVQVSAFPQAYARWETIARQIAGLLGGDLPVITETATGEDCAPDQDATVPVTVATLNVAGSRPAWTARLPKVIDALQRHDVTIASLQDVPDAAAQQLVSRYRQAWGIYPAPANSGADNRVGSRVVWDRSSWKVTESRLVDVPGGNQRLPLVHLTSTQTAQSIWVASVQQPTGAGARDARVSALRTAAATVKDLAGSGDPVVIAGSFNDAGDAAQASQCVLTPAVTNAFPGGSNKPCKRPAKDAPDDHIYAAGLSWASAKVDTATQSGPTRIGDHPLVVATSDANSSPCQSGAGPGSSGACGKIVYPVQAAYVGNDAHNWHNSGSSWGSWHTGTDFSAPCGTPVYAATAGTVEIDTSQSWAGPHLVKVTTGAHSLTTWYAHMEKVTVARGQKVQPGQQIGMVGNLGNSHGCHLHFEVHLKNGSIYGPDNVNPSAWLATNTRATDPAA